MVVEVDLGSVVGPPVGDDVLVLFDVHAASAVPAARAPRPFSNERRLRCDAGIG